MLQIGTKFDNTNGATGQLDASEFNDLNSELEQPVIDSAQIMQISKTPNQLSRAMTLRAMEAMSWIENSGSANLSNLTPFDGGTTVVFSTAFITGNSIVITINSTPLSAVNFTTSNANTYALILAAIQAAYPSATVTVNATYTVILMYLAGTVYTISVVVTGGASQPLNFVSYGFPSPDSYAEMNGAVIAFNKSTENTTTPQVNIGPTTAGLLGALNVVQVGGGTIASGGMVGHCRIRFNLLQNYWELIYTDAWLNQRGYNDFSAKNLETTFDWHTLNTKGSGLFSINGAGQTNSPDGSTTNEWKAWVNERGADTTDLIVIAMNQTTNIPYFLTYTASVWSKPYDMLTDSAWEAYLTTALDVKIAYNGDLTINTITYYSVVGSEDGAHTMGVKTFAYSNQAISTLTIQIYLPIGTLKFTRTTTFTYNADNTLQKTTTVLS